MLLDKKNIHFVGIGGIGMSGLAYVLREMGYNISGSDLSANNLTERIGRMGGRIFKGHRPSNIPIGAEVLVYSSSISKDNPELIEAKRRKMEIAHRAEMMGELFNGKRGIAVTGTHGKTTTTSLISVVLEDCGADPTVMIGGEVDRFDGNAKLGEGEYLVAEADESDSSFLNLKPFYSVVTNIDMEHIDHYRTFQDALDSYRAFIENTKKGGKVFYNYEDCSIKKILKGYRGSVESFGFSDMSDIRPARIRMKGFKTSFDCIYKGKVLGEVALEIPGEHNVLNSLAAILVGLNMGLEFQRITDSLKYFKGAKRRFQLRADSGGVMLIDDYAHHPTEIRAVLDACRNWNYKRLIVIFQPHRYTRTLYLADDFGKCFAGADILILTDIYAASEEPIKGVSVENIYERAVRSGIGDVRMMRKKDIAGRIMNMKKRGDMILVLGAGDICDVADEIAGRFSEDPRRRKKDVSTGLKSLIKGAVRFGEKMAPHTSFKIGGPADIWAQPRNPKELKSLLIFAKGKKLPVLVIGMGSNILVRDSGFRGLVISLNSPFFKKVKIEGKRLSVGAGFGISPLVRLCCERGLGGIESLIGIPGTVGGAVYMNAGGSTNPIFRNIGDFVTSLKAMDYSGRLRKLKNGDLRFGYRHSNLDPYIILEVVLKLEKGDRVALNSRCSMFLKMKREKQALDVPSAGCVFKNPQKSQFTCGQMIDMLGLKGKRIGGAQVSEKHANFIVNRSDATCGDVLKLVEFIKNKVLENYDIPLELEIEVI